MTQAKGSEALHYHAKLCFNCLSPSLANFPKSRYQLSGGCLKCPANSCIGGISFETFIKRECCTVAQSLRAKETFEKIDIDLQKVKRNSSAEAIETVSEELDSFIEKYSNFFPKNDRNSCAVCLEKYDDKKRIECTLLCGHRSCFECLTQLPNENCPTCRKAFTNEQIIKLF
ncbi:unnamed protein product [Oikopleura dioica]|uniref:RING-type domain-containing protein n=1 Tax=Oikopleura dioica TaxID=34765 RepID=E4XV02_OIKDI|nr:unnamed protein product [Oikopleura dioica]